MNKKLRTVLAIGVALKGAALVTAAVVAGYKNHKKYNEKFEKALDKDIRLLYLEEKAHEINMIYKAIEPLFISSQREGDLDIEEKEPFVEVALDIETNNFVEVDLDFDDLLGLPTKKGYYKLIGRSDKNKHTEFILRVTVEDWDGYIDITICEVKGTCVKGEHLFIVKRRGETFTLTPDLDKAIYLNIERINGADFLMSNPETLFMIPMKESF